MRGNASRALPPGLNNARLGKGQSRWAGAEPPGLGRKGSHVTLPSMIAHNPRLVLLALGSTLLASACGPSAAEQKAKFDEIQKKADDRVAQLEKTSKDQLAGAQKQIA